MRLFAGAAVRPAGFRFFPWLAFLLIVIGAPCASAQIAAPAITTQPQNLTLNPGSSGSLTVTASGTGTLSYRWFKSGTALADGGGLTGTLTATLSFSSAQSGFAGSYSVVVSNSGGSVTSNSVAVTVAIILPPAITSINNLSVLPSSPMTFTVTATNSPTAFAATGFPAGLSIDTVAGIISGTPTVQGIYSLVLSVTNAIGTSTQNFTLTVEAALPSYADKLFAGSFSSPSDLAVDSSGNVFVTDAGNHTVAKVTPSGNMTIIAGRTGQAGSSDGIATGALFLSPGGVAVDRNGNVYVSDTGNHTIRKIAPDGTVSTLAGTAGLGGSADGAVAAARFLSPQGIAVDATGVVYVADTGNYTIRKISVNGIVTTIAGSPGISDTADGTGSAAHFTLPTRLALDSAGNIYVTDRSNNCIRKISATNTVTTIAIVLSPTGIALDSSGNIFIATAGNGDRALQEITAVGTQRTLSLKPVYQLTSRDGDSGFSSATIPFGAVGVGCDSAGNFYWIQTGLTIDKGLHKAAAFFPVSITAAPQNQSVIAGTPATFSVTATGQPLSYAWAPSVTYFYPYLSSSGPTVTLTDQPGLYFVVVYNIGSAARASFQFSVNTVRPSIVTQPSPQSVAIGQNASFSVAATGAPAPTYQWSFNGTPISGATGATYTLASAQPTNAGNYQVTATNSAGTVTSSSAALVVVSLPVVATAPQAKTVYAGNSVTLSATASGISLSYQWQLNGGAIAGATDSTLTLTNAQLASAGNYSVVISNLAGWVTTTPVAVDVITTRLVNLSARGPVGGGNILIVGFVTNGSTSKQLLIRGIGPTLASFGVSNALTAPQLTLFDSKPGVLGANGGWGGAAALADAFVQVGAFALPTNSADSALLRNLPAGLYSSQLSGVGNAAGVGLAEIYDADIGTPAARLINLSASGFVGTGGNVLIAGFVIAGNRPAKILVRAIGPTLGLFGVSGALASPQLTLFDSAGKTVATSTAWGGDTALSAAFTQVGAFALPLSSNDSALLATLPPGNYTALVNGVAGATGVALVEVYEVP